MDKLPIELIVPQYLRCFMDVPARPVGQFINPDAVTIESPVAKAIRDIGAPYEGYCFVFDTETVTDTTQVLRIGAYAVYGISVEERMRWCQRGQLTREKLDTCAERGIFYNPATVTTREVEIIQRYARKRHQKVWTDADFVDAVFYPWVYHKEALCIGHNLPFDLSRLPTDSTRWGVATGRFHGGFWFSLCECPAGRKCFKHPPIRIKMLGSKKASIEFGKTSPPIGKAKKYRGKFLDTATFGLALLGPGNSTLEAMGKRFKAYPIKKEWPGGHGAPITEAYLDYAVGDVDSTWALYRAERAEGVKSFV